MYGTLKIPVQTSMPEVLWLDLGRFEEMNHTGNPLAQWQDHGLGLLRTICHLRGLHTSVASLRAMTDWNEFSRVCQGFDTLCLNVRSYNLSLAREAAQRFRAVNRKSRVIAGGMHATIAADDMRACESFDVICTGPGEIAIADLIMNTSSPHIVAGQGAKRMDDWPWIERELWPRSGANTSDLARTWPLEPECGWGPPPVATLISSRVCPWRCAFCNEASYIPHIQRRSVRSIIDELNSLDIKYGVGSVVFHDSLFFQNPSWLAEWLEEYPRRARKVWPYWAAARSDLVARWPDLFEALVKETNWSTISIGFESGSDRVLRILNKECTVDQNLAVIDRVNRLGDAMVKDGKTGPQFWANIMLGIPGERPGDAIDTMAMLMCMRRAQPSLAYYTAYPGTALGNQIIAEGKSRLGSDPERYPDGQKARGVDYDFYTRLRQGRLNKKVESARRAMEGRMRELRGLPPPTSEHGHLYLLFRNNGNRVLSYGSGPADAVHNWQVRQTDPVSGDFDLSQCRRIRQQDMRRYSGKLT